MKIKLLGNAKIGGYSYKMGTEIEVDRPTGNKLIGKKVAIEQDFVTLTDEIAEKVSEKKSEDIIENLPTNAKKLISVIGKLVNIPTLEHLLNDQRISVRTAAANRLEQLH